MTASIAILKSQTVFDVISDGKLKYWEQIALIEANNKFIFNNSPESEQKRYYRWRNYFDTRIDSTGSMKSWKNAWIDMQRKDKSLNYSDLTWTQIGPFENQMNDKSNNGQLKRVIANPNNPAEVYVGTVNSGLWKTTDINETSPNWQLLTPDLGMIGIYGLQIDYTNPQNIYIATGIRVFKSYSSHANSALINPEYSLGIFKSANGGLTWAKILDTDPSEMKMFREMKMHPTNPNILWAITPTSIYKTINAGTTWTSVLLPNSEGANYFELDVNRQNPNEIFVSGGNCIAKSIDGGVTWTSNLPEHVRQVFYLSGGINFGIKNVENNNYTSTSLQANYLYNYKNGYNTALAVGDNGIINYLSSFTTLLMKVDV